MLRRRQAKQWSYLTSVLGICVLQNIRRDTRFALWSATLAALSRRALRSHQGLHLLHDLPFQILVANAIERAQELQLPLAFTFVAYARVFLKRHRGVKHLCPRYLTWTLDRPLEFSQRSVDIFPKALAFLAHLKSIPPRRCDNFIHARPTTDDRLPGQ